jgi:putative lipoprotein
MRKAFIVLTGILFTLLFATCKQFTADIDDYLSRWSSEAFIQSSTIDKKTYNDGSSIPSVASADKVTITLKVQNPKSFRFVMPSASETRKIVEFAHFAGTKPAAGTDYELIQPSADTLKLVYKDSFLKKAEWGEEDISSTITLYANDGRPPFKQTFTIPLKANTPPPKPGYAVAKTTGTTAYYVLCITVPDMDKTAGGGLLHKDLACIEVNGTPYTFSVDEGQHKFTKPESPFFIVQPDPPNPPNIKKLTDPDADNVPTGGWVLFYKTDVEVKDGAAKKDYTIKLIDKKGLASDIVNASTKPNKPETEIVRITKGEKIPGSGSGSSESDPTIIGTDSSRATLSVSSATANTTVHCTLTEIGSSTPAKYDGNPVTVPLPLNGAGEKKYKLEYYTDGTGFAATQIKTVYYKVAKGHTVTYRVEIVDEVAGGTIEAGSTGQKTSGTVLVVRGDSVTLKGRPATEDWKVAEWSSNVTPSSDKKQATLSNVTADTTVTVKFYQSTLKNPATWKDLARAVKSAPDNATLTINGKIQATDVDADKSEIDIKKNLTIKGENSAILDADGKKGIFDVYKTLTLQDITLTNSKKPYNYSGGAGVYVNSNGKLIMKGSSVITECRAENSGGGVYVGGGTFEMHDSSKITGCSANKGGAIFVNGATVNITNGTLKGNEAAEAGGAIYAQKQKDGPTSTVTISGGTIGGTGTGEKNKVTGKWHFGGGIFVNDDCTLTLNSVQIIGNEAWRAGGVRANRSTVNMTNCTIKNNKTTGDDDSGGGGVYTFMGRLTMTGCTITGNEAATNGGGLNVEGTTTNITNCTFTRNTAKNGGGIYTIKTDSYPVVTISGGTIGDTDMDSANKATGSDGNGGGIYVGEFCTLRLQDSTDSGVRIIGNQAAKGGGVYAKNTIVSMQGRTQIEVDNNDVYLDSGSLISIVESLAATGPVARITVPNDKYQTATEVLTGSAVNTEYRKFTVTPKGSENWTVGSDGQLTNNKTDIFNTITRDQIKAAIKAADPSMIYDDWRNPITNRKAKLTNKLVLYETAQGHYGIMHVTEVDNTTYGGKGHIKFNSKTFNQYGGVLRKETDKVLTGDESFQFEAGRDPGSNLDFTFGNGTTDEEKTFKPLNGAKFYILSN